MVSSETSPFVLQMSTFLTLVLILAENVGCRWLRVPKEPLQPSVCSSGVGGRGQSTPSDQSVRRFKDPAPRLSWNNPEGPSHRALGRGPWDENGGQQSHVMGHGSTLTPRFSESLSSPLEPLLILMPEKVPLSILFLGFSTDSDSHAPGDSH